MSNYLIELTIDNSYEELVIEAPNLDELTRSGIIDIKQFFIKELRRLLKLGKKNQILIQRYQPNYKI